VVACECVDSSADRQPTKRNDAKDAASNDVKVGLLSSAATKEFFPWMSWVVIIIRAS
jgi:hypothetical protein